RLREKWRMTVLVLTAAALCLVSLTAEAAAAEEPYKVGAVFAITGPAASLGEPERDTVMMMEEQINRAGGINGHPLEMIVYDTAGDETKCVMAVKRLIERDKVLAIVGPSRTGTSLAIIETIQRARVPLVSCAAGIQIVEPVKEWVFKTPQSDVLAVRKILVFLKSKGIKRVAIMSVSNAFGESGKNELKRYLPAAGVQIVAEETYGDRDTDVTPQLIRIKTKDPDAIINWDTSVGAAVMTKNAHQLRLKSRLILSHGVANKTYLDLAGEATEGVVFPAGKLLVAGSLSADDPQRDILIKYAEDFERKYKRTADTFGGHAWDAVSLVVRALRKVGPDRAKIRLQIENTKGFVGTGGIFNFSREDHNGLTEEAFVMVKVVNGKWTVAD
ncbi:MAG: ABC transporter substrate-binding protein, partial [Armatimonadota bacterium]|nr:ABC transporter substrate-binding protein [Armatimonadota bacterium]